MSKYLLSTLILINCAMAFPISAESTKSMDVPDKVVANILKRHPKARDMKISRERHFGIDLLEVAFKEQEDEQFFELFTQQGHLFTSELLIEDLDQISPKVIDSLKQQFPKYSIKKAELIGNPNGIGEEYEIYLDADGISWKISIDDQGHIEQKDRV